jgi:thiamine transporter
METKKRITALQLVESALMIAVATVCSIVKIDLPFGGGVTIVSMLPLILISHRYGWKWGVLTAFTYSIVQMILGLDNVGYATSFLMGAGIVLLDYVIAYTVIGLSGIFGKDRKAVAIGIAVTFALRFCCHLISGAWIWGVWMPEEFMGMKMTSPWIYSALYNGWYMLAELVATELIAMLIYKPLEKYFRGEELAQPKENA